MLSRYRGRTSCTTCEGKRLRKDTQYVKINEIHWGLVDMPAHELLDFMQQLKLNDQDQQVAERLLTEIISRLDFLCEVGLSYLTLNRSQTVCLEGSHNESIWQPRWVAVGWVDVYPRRAKHRSTPQRHKTIDSHLEKLRDLGNTVIVVEHDEDIVRAAEIVILALKQVFLEEKLLCKVPE